jgi:hypothetical protein
VVCRGVKCLHLESSSEELYALRALVYPALAGKQAMADRIRGKNAIPRVPRSQRERTVLRCKLAGVWAIRGWRATGLSGSGD